MRYDEAALRAAWGDRPFAVYDQVESTFAPARIWEEAGAPHGAVILADSQTAGRGRFGRPFLSPPGTGLYLQLILRRGLAHADLVTPLAAVAVCRAVRDVCGLDCDIKWANDVLRAGRKLCGILSEARRRDGALRAVSLGIGINVNTQDLPEGIHATSLLHETGRPVSREALAIALVAHLDALADALEDEDDTAAWRAAYARRCVTLGRAVVVHAGGDPCPAQALGLDESLRLQVRYEDGRTEWLHTGDVSVRPA